MRVALATTAREPGGVWRHMLDLAGGLRDRGDQVTLVIPSAAGNLAAAAAAARFETASLTRSLRRPVDLVHLHLHRSMDIRSFALVPVWRATRGNRAVVITEHLPRAPGTDPSLAYDPNLPSGVKKPGAAFAKLVLKRSQARLASRVICVSERSRAFMIERWGLAPERVVRIHNGVHGRPDGEAPQLPAGPISVVCVGAVCWRKGHDLLIDAARRSRHPWSVEVVGDGVSRATFQDRASSEVPGRFRFAGWSDDVAAHVAQAHIACLPSRWEAFPYSVIEAMALGRAVVGSRVDGIPEIVVDGETGILIDPGDPAALAAALDHLYERPDLVRSMGRAGFEAARQVITIDQMVMATRRVYERCIGA